MYELCLKAGITIVSVGHRESLEKFHHFKLQINPATQAWTLLEKELPATPVSAAFNNNNNDNSSGNSTGETAAAIVNPFDEIVAEDTLQPSTAADENRLLNF